MLRCVVEFVAETASIKRVSISFLVTTPTSKVIMSFYPLNISLLAVLLFVIHDNQSIEGSFSIHELNLQFQVIP